MSGPTRSGGWLTWGTAAALAYVAAVACCCPQTRLARLLYDGYVPPPPYRWVRPPAAVARSNQLPAEGRGVVALTPQGSAPAAVATDDEQAVVVLPKGAIEPRPGERFVEVRLTPLDPASLGPAPPGVRYDGNAYRVTATYAISHRPAPLAAAVNVVLRYATGANVVLQRTGSGWTRLASTTIPPNFQVYAPTRDLGVFVAAGPPPHGVPLSVWVYRIVTGLLWLLVAVLLWLLLRDVVRRRPLGRGGPSRRRAGWSGG